MTFLPSSDELEFQEAVRRFLAQEHDCGTIRRVYRSGPAEREGIAASCRDFGMLEWVREGGIRAVALLAREAGRALIAAPVVTDALWGVWLPSVVVGMPWGVDEACAGAVRVCAALEGLSVGTLVEGAPGARYLVEICSKLGEVAIYNLEEGSFVPIAPLDGTMVLGELQRALPEPVARVSVDRAALRFLRAAWRLIHAAQVIGAAERCVELFQDHGRTRKQFGVPIAGFQAVQQQAAAHFANLAAASALTSFAEWCGVHDHDQFEEAALSAWHAAVRMGRPLAEAMVQIHGGIGFTWEYDLHLYLRRIVALELLYPLTVEEERQLLGGLSGGGKGDEQR
jgi:hypothetical protein